MADPPDVPGSDRNGVPRALSDVLKVGGVAAVAAGVVLSYFVAADVATESDSVGALAASIIVFVTGVILAGAIGALLVAVGYLLAIALDLADGGSGTTHDPDFVDLTDAEGGSQEGTEAPTAGSSSARRDHSPAWFGEATREAAPHD